MTNNILDKIGNTPLVEIKRLNPNPDVTVLAKLEYMNPGGSVKDRAALYMIEAGEKSGELTRDKTVIEATSGNTGVAYSLVGAALGYRVALVMPSNVTQARNRASVVESALDGANDWVRLVPNDKEVTAAELQRYLGAVRGRSPTLGDVHSYSEGWDCGFSSR